mmetsp:Transcript_1129/g.2437  ORF Transcript_1129/g.2437 Transcript_1129/m.2437 type:complete len:273 (+) Transcript_1129:922-1740(+)
MCRLTDECIPSHPNKAAPTISVPSSSCTVTCSSVSSYPLTPTPQRSSPMPDRVRSAVVFRFFSSPSSFWISFHFSPSRACKKKCCIVDRLAPYMPTLGAVRMVPPLPSSVAMCILSYLGKASSMGSPSLSFMMDIAVEAKSNPLPVLEHTFERAARSIRTNGTLPCCSRTSAARSPAGPAPTMMMGLVVVVESLFVIIFFFQMEHKKCLRRSRYYCYCLGVVDCSGRICVSMCTRIMRPDRFNLTQLSIPMRSCQDAQWHQRASWGHDLGHD